MTLTNLHSDPMPFRELTEVADLLDTHMPLLREIRVVPFAEPTKKWGETSDQALFAYMAGRKPHQMTMSQGPYQVHPPP